MNNDTPNKPVLNAADQAVYLPLFSGMLDLWRRLQNTSEAKDIKERFDIARRFNDRYTYRVKFVSGTDTLPGTFYGGPTDAGNAWMCPQCNRIHHPVSCSVFSGLQYPACCSTGEGHRLSHGIRTP